MFASVSIAYTIKWMPWNMYDVAVVYGSLGWYTVQWVLFVVVNFRVTINKCIMELIHGFIIHNVGRRLHRAHAYAYATNFHGFSPSRKTRKLAPP